MWQSQDWGHRIPAEEAKAIFFFPGSTKSKKKCQIVSRHVQPPDDIATGQKKNIVIPVCLPDAPASVHPAYRGIAVEEFENTRLFSRKLPP